MKDMWRYSVLMIFVMWIIPSSA